MASLVFTCSSFAQTPSPSASGNAKHPFTFEDMMALKRVGAPVPSPGGKWVVFGCEDVDYRIDVSQGFDLFTTLQVLKVPSKML